MRAGMQVQGCRGAERGAGHAGGAAEWDGGGRHDEGWRFLPRLPKGLEVWAVGVCGAGVPVCLCKGGVCARRGLCEFGGDIFLCEQRKKKWRSKADPTPQVSFFGVAEACWKEKGAWGCPHPCQGGRGGLWSSRQGLLCQEAHGDGAGGLRQRLSGTAPWARSGTQRCNK